MTKKPLIAVLMGSKSDEPGVQKCFQILKEFSIPFTCTEELTKCYEVINRKNLELDALHFVWCDGGCKSGVHRFTDLPPLTKEIVDQALINTTRLFVWYDNNEFTKLHNEKKLKWFKMWTGYHLKRFLLNLRWRLCQLDHRLSDKYKEST